MRPRDPERRKRYREAVARLRASNLPISAESVARELGIKWNTVRTFMYRNPRLAKELGLETHGKKIGIEYLDAAIKIVERDERLTGYSLAKELGRDHSPVYGYLRKHLLIRALIYKKTGVRIGKGTIPAWIVPGAKINLRGS